MNSKGHLYVSIAKSTIRLCGCGLTLLVPNVLILAVTFGIAEILGILEEILDER